MRLQQRSVLAAAITSGLIVGISHPVGAGAACNRLDLRSPCVQSSDLKANVILGGNSEGRLRIRDSGTTTIELRGRTGNVTNTFSNNDEESNGLVKAWAKIDASGAVIVCWRCNPFETNRLGVGFYEVDFTPLSTDIRGRPRSASSDGLGGLAAPIAFTTVTDRSYDFSSIFVATQTDEFFIDSPFVLVVY